MGMLINENGLVARVGYCLVQLRFKPLNFFVTVVFILVRIGKTDKMVAVYYFVSVHILIDIFFVVVESVYALGFSFLDEFVVAHTD